MAVDADLKADAFHLSMIKFRDKNFTGMIAITREDQFRIANYEKRTETFRSA